MILDFSFWLLVLSVVSGLIWAVDSLFFKPARVRQQGLDTSTNAAALPEPIIVEYARSFFPVLMIVFVLRSFLFEPFRIPSDSMMPGLRSGDFIFVSKFSYGIRLPIINHTVLDTGKPQRGDVIVFRLPRDPSVNYIKRLIGLPGDHVQVVNDQVYINGAVMTQEHIGVYADEHYPYSPMLNEDLGNMKHVIMLLPGYSPKDFDGVVPAGKYLFMGDNRDNSQDGRFAAEVGYVPDENLVGRAQLIWFNFRPWNMPIFSRIGTRIR